MSYLLSVGALSVVYLVVAKLERSPRLRFRALPSPRPYLATDVTWYLLALGATAVSVFVFRPVLSRFVFGPTSEMVDAWPVAVQFLLALVVFDFLSFAVHVGLHRSDRLWQFHKVHHSTLQLDGFATTRAHTFENLVRFVPPQAALFVIGLPASVVAPAVAIAAIYGVSNHSNLGVRLGWAEALFVTPRLHRRHHVPATTQHNYGTIFTMWDRLFGTLVQVDTADDEQFGVPGEIDAFPQRFAPAFRQPLRSAFANV